MKAREKAEEMFRNSSLELMPFNTYLLFDLMINFAEIMCEKQKQECLKNFQEENFNNIKSVNYVENSILNANNVCDL